MSHHRYLTNCFFHILHRGKHDLLQTKLERKLNKKRNEARKVERSVELVNRGERRLRAATSRHLELTCAHCRTYICAFTSNYPGRGNPVRRRTASTREDQRTRYSELLHSSPPCNAASTLGGRNHPPFQGNSAKLCKANAYLHHQFSSQRSFRQLSFLFLFMETLDFGLKREKRKGKG